MVEIILMVVADVTKCALVTANRKYQTNLDVTLVIESRSSYKLI
jgi:hypothetical protein